jgi:hypothetical protein
VKCQQSVVEACEAKAISWLAPRNEIARLPLETNTMPEISRFYGIIIRMFSEPSVRHHAPHFHAYYNDHVAVFSISPVALIIGFIPKRQQRLVEAWTELHQDELLTDWQLLEQGRKPSPINPLQ